LVRGRKEKFPADRVTIMIEDELDARLKMDLAKAIMNCAKIKCTANATSYSRILNEILAKEFEKGTDKKIVSAKKPQ